MTSFFFHSTATNGNNLISSVKSSHGGGGGDVNPAINALSFSLSVCDTPTTVNMVHSSSTLCRGLGGAEEEPVGDVLVSEESFWDTDGDTAEGERSVENTRSLTETRAT